MSRFRRIWITGASSGLGEAVAILHAREGADVAISARNAEELARVAALVPGRLHAFPLDVTDQTAAAATAAAIEEKLGPLDLVIFNAGTHQPMGLGDFEPAVFERLFRVNFFGAVNGLAAMLPRMTARHAGKIVVVASVAGYRGLPSAAAYGATKAALINMVEALQPEAAQAGVELALVNPGFIKTPLTDKNDFPMPALMPVERAARRMVDGLEGRTFELTFPRRFTWVLKLLRLLPYRLYLPLVAKATLPPQTRTARNGPERDERSDGRS